MPGALKASKELVPADGLAPSSHGPAVSQSDPTASGKSVKHMVCKRWLHADVQLADK